MGGILSTPKMSSVTPLPPAPEESKAVEETAIEQEEIEKRKRRLGKASTIRTSTRGLLSGTEGTDKLGS